MPPRNRRDHSSQPKSWRQSDGETGANSLHFHSDSFTMVLHKNIALKDTPGAGKTLVATGPIKKVHALVNICPKVLRSETSPATKSSFKLTFASVNGVCLDLMPLGNVK